MGCRSHAGATALHLVRAWAWARMAGMAIDPTALKPVRNLPASIHLQAEACRCWVVLASDDVKALTQQGVRLLQIMAPSAMHRHRGRNKVLSAGLHPICSPALKVTAVEGIRVTS